MKRDWFDYLMAGLILGTALLIGCVAYSEHKSKERCELRGGTYHKSLCIKAEILK
jgi:hypothetical protein